MLSHHDLWGNYTSAWVHHTLQVSVRSDLTRMRKARILKNPFLSHTQTPKPTVCSYQKHTHTHTHPKPSFFLLVGVHTARKQPLNNLTPTFITTLQCPILFCSTSVPRQSELNIALHKNPSFIHLERDASDSWWLQHNKKGDRSNHVVVSSWLCGLWVGMWPRLGCAQQKKTVKVLWTNDNSWRWLTAYI